MSDKITIIYRRDHAGNPPTKAVMHGKLPMRTLDPKRLAQAGSIQPSHVRRRALSKRGTVILSLLLLGLLVVAALVATSERKAHAQEISHPWCEIAGAPMPQSIPQSSACIMPRMYLPEVRK